MKFLIIVIIVLIVVVCILAEDSGEAERRTFDLFKKDKKHGHKDHHRHDFIEDDFRPHHGGFYSDVHSGFHGSSLHDPVLYGGHFDAGHFGGGLHGIHDLHDVHDLGLHGGYDGFGDIQHFGGHHSLHHVDSFGHFGHLGHF